MVSKPTSHLSAGTGQPPRPGADDSPPTITHDWQDWYEASRLDRRPPTQPEAEPAPEAEASPMPEPSSRRADRLRFRRRVVALVTGAAAVVAVFNAGVLYADLHSPHETAAATTPHVPAPLPATRVAAPPAPTATVIVQAPSNVPVFTRSAGAGRAAPPTRISIPALRINQRLIGLQVNADRQLNVPQNYNDIGWWSTGPAAGDPGAAVVVGHVDSMVGPAVFYRLSSLTKGAIIAVGRADGTTAKFTVTKLQAFSKQHFPDKLVYRTSGRPSLHLLTCGGPYDRSTGYQANVVVFADMVKPKRVSKPEHGAKSTTSARPRVTAKRGPTGKAHQAREPKVTSSSRESKAIADAYNRSIAGTAGPGRQAPSGR